MTPSPVSLAAALTAVITHSPVELAAVIVSFDQQRQDLAALASDLRETGRGDVAELVEVLTVRARQSLLGFFDRAERQTPAPVAEPVRSIEEIGESIKKKLVAKKGGGK